MKQKLEEIRARAEAELQKIDSLADLEALRVQVLGKKGELTAILKSMGSLSRKNQTVKRRTNAPRNRSHAGVRRERAG